MASANQKRASIIAQRLNLLREQKSHLIGAVDEYVDKVNRIGNLWIDGGENTMDFIELCQMIDAAIDLIVVKADEMSGTSLTNEVVSPMSTQASTLETKELPTSSSTTSYRQATAASPSQAPDDSMLCQALARIGVMEEDICSLRNNVEKISEKQNGLDSKIIEMSSTFTDSNKTQSDKYNNLNEQVQKLNENQIEIMKEQKSRLRTLEKFEKQLQKMSSKQDKMKEVIKSQIEINDTIKNITDKNDDHFEKLQNLEYEMHDLSDKVQHLKDETHHLSDKVQHLEDETCDLPEKIQHLDNKTCDLPEKLDASNKELVAVSESQKSIMTSLDAVETQLSEIKENSNVENLKKDVQESKTNVEILCQLLNKRLRPVEELRKCLNQHAITRDDNVRKLCEVIKEVSAITPRLRTLESQLLKPDTGVSASSVHHDDKESSLQRPITLRQRDLKEAFVFQYYGTPGRKQN